MPVSSADPMASVGYLIAAMTVTVVGLVGYGVMLARRLEEARAERTSLRR